MSDSKVNGNDDREVGVKSSIFGSLTEASKITFQSMTRKKSINEKDMNESNLKRVLTVYDLTALGVGATLGAGVYVLTGKVGRFDAGPGTVIAFLIAALTSILAGLCYAEFGARVPKAGSGYVYSYVTVGEVTAFVIGWNLILSYVIGAASVGKTWVSNLDVLFDNVYKKAMESCCAMDTEFIADYPDFFAFGLILFLTLLIAFGVEEFTIVNKLFTVLNVIVLVFIIITGLTQADFKNWQWNRNEIKNFILNKSVVTEGHCKINNVSFLSEKPNGTSYINSSYCVISDDKEKTEWPGDGGFFPYGARGLLRGTASCFYAFVGFDIIATTGEEAINPQKNIPISIVASLLVCCFAYLGVSASLTLMMPYFLFNTDIPITAAFKYSGLAWAEIPVTIGAICALSTSLLGAMFPMPRIIYAMAMDGLLFKFLAKVNNKTKTPVIACFVSGLFAAFMAMIIKIDDLVDLMSIGTLAAYTLVAVSVLLLRYQPDEHSSLNTDSSLSIEKSFCGKLFPYKLFNRKMTNPTLRTSNIVTWCVVIISILSIAMGLTIRFGGTSTAGIVLAVVFIGWIILTGIVITLQPQSKKQLAFRVPWVPLVPILNIIINICLMMQLSDLIWIMMSIWMAAGFSIYFFYGIWNSVEAKRVISPIVEFNEDLKLSKVIEEEIPEMDQA